MVNKNLSLLFPLVLAGVLHGGTVDPVLRRFVPKENVFLPAGTILVGQTMSAVFSYNVAVPVIINLDEPAVCPKTNVVVFPKGTRLLAWANVLKSDNRVNMSVYKAILPAPSGKEIDLSGIVLQPDGSAGLTGTKKEYKDVKFAASAAAGALSGIGQAVSQAPTMSPITAGAVGGVLQSGASNVAEGANQKIDVSISIERYQKVSIFLLERVALDAGEPADIKPGHGK